MEKSYVEILVMFMDIWVGMSDMCDGVWGWIMFGFVFEDFMMFVDCLNWVLEFEDGKFFIVE